MENKLLHWDKFWEEQANALTVRKSLPLNLSMERFFMNKTKMKKPEQFSATFSQKIPKGIICFYFRTDLWSMYVDLEVKFGTIDKAREILERCLTIKLKRKKMITVLKKYHQI